MSREGFDLAEIEPVVPGEDIDPSSVRGSADFRSAHNTCVVLSGIGDVVGDTPDEVAEKDERALAMTKCMRDAGWEMPDPVRDQQLGYLIPGSPQMPANVSEQQAQLNDLQRCGEEVGIGVQG